MQHSFDVDIAKDHSIIEAILLNNLWFWIEKNKANKINFYDGYYWTYNSTKAFNELFPYTTQRQIQNALKKLKDKGIIQTGNYNKSSYDRTLWYAFTKKGECIMQKCKMEDTEMSNGIGDNVEPIPDINTGVKPNDETHILSNRELELEFNELWIKYPNKKNKPKALKYYIEARKKGTTKEQVEKGIDNYNKEISIKKTDRQYIKHGSTWFYNQCWLDDYDFTSPKQNASNNYKRVEEVPEWLNKDIKKETASDEEIKELENAFKEFKPNPELQERLRTKYGKGANMH